MSNLVGKKAPNFKSKAVVKGEIKEQFTLDSLSGQYVCLFFYPLDFTFVCPTELHAFQEKYTEFTKRGVQLVGCSVDSPFSHVAWLNTPQSKGGIEGVEYPLLSDLNKEIATTYGVLKEDEGIAYRGLFLIDREGIVRHQLINDLPLGRSVDETLRMIDALIFFETNGEVCPANWKTGAKSMKATPEGLVDYFAKPVSVN
ncbi:MAG: Alkyl hydroperoxide reductase C [Chlamydiales bacterium]|nr:Alkyl hydroperoxide reductase C [Chlamydiales bacterium]MCH9619550.1 Alkyl hydroperoxide reductase C [Chlamydiales bacterium]MCH9623156.1 Alkyl hydroperoxide reductase C [Chlamydiales bacterium]